MTNPIVDKLNSAIVTSPYVIERERYQMAVEEITRLQAIVDQLSTSMDEPEQDDQDLLNVCYPGEPWHADESNECVRIFRAHHQIIKAPKHGTPYEEYWPEPDMIMWMLKILNQAEQAAIPTCDI